VFPTDKWSMMRSSERPGYFEFCCVNHRIYTPPPASFTAMIARLLAGPGCTPALLLPIGPPGWFKAVGRLVHLLLHFECKGSDNVKESIG
jgi:hypothetical protein